MNFSDISHIFDYYTGLKMKVKHRTSDICLMALTLKADISSPNALDAPQISQDWPAV